jgi:hypothetical protein
MVEATVQVTSASVRMLVLIMRRLFSWPDANRFAQILFDERWASLGGDPRFGDGRSGRYAAPVDAVVPLRLLDLTFSRPCRDQQFCLVRPFEVEGCDRETSCRQ